MSMDEISILHRRSMGYKQNEYIIPSGWTLSPLNEVAPLQRGFDLPTSQIRSGPYPVVYSNGVLEYHDQSMVKSPGVVTGRSGTIGKVHFIEKDYWPHNTSLWVTSFCGNDPKFIYYLYTHINLARLLSGSGVPTLNRNDVHQHKVACPPPTEQRAIAEALSDVDGLLAALEELIAKKRAVKQAAMQQLLTGKTRLPGFSGTWETKRVSEFGDIVTGATPRTDIDAFWGEQYPWITPTDISFQRDMISSERMITQEGLNSIRTLPANSVLVTCIASIGKNAILKTKGSCNQQINAVIPNAAHSAEFLYYLFELNTRYLLAKAGITATSIVSKKIFGELSFKIPFVEEQQAIVAVLSDMDAEIAVLERRRDKAHAIKQGMMQQLLTGRIRLINKSRNK